MSHDVIVHQQPGGEVVMTTTLPDGRLFRVCGGRPDHADRVSQELDRMLRWLKQTEDELPDWLLYPIDDDLFGEGG